MNNNVTHINKDKVQNGHNPDAPVVRPREKSKSLNIVETVLGSNLSPLQKVEALTSVLDQTGGKGQPGGRNHAMAQWIGQGLLLFLVLGDMFGGAFANNNEELVEQLNEIKITMTEQNTEISTKLDQLHKRADESDARLLAMETQLTRLTTTDDELISGMSEFIDAAGYKYADVPPAVRLVIMRNESRKLEGEK